jgi:uncharacterized protein DUF5522
MRSCGVAWPTVAQHRLGESIMARELIEGIDYTLDEQGRQIFTAAYLLSLGYCCNLDCRNCPYRAKACSEQEKPEAA